METTYSSVLERVVQLTLERYKDCLFFLTEPRSASSRTWGMAGSIQRGLVGFESFCECLNQVTFLSWALKSLGQADTSEFNEHSNTDENVTTQIRFIQRKLSFLTDCINKAKMSSDPHSKRTVLVIKEKNKTKQYYSQKKSRTCC